MDFSPRQAETLQLSPAHSPSVSSIHDELKNLRRSMSRSPSRSVRSHRPLVEVNTSSNPSPITHERRAHEVTTSTVHSPRDTGSLAAARKLRPILTRSTPIKGGFFTSTRIETPPRASVRQPLGVTKDFGNSSSQSSQEHSEGQENEAKTPEGSPPDSNIFNAPKAPGQDTPFQMRHHRPRSIATTDVDSLREWTPARSSPLKRSDGVLNLDQPSFGSPSAKRRSLHGPTFEIARDDDFRFEPTRNIDETPSYEESPRRSAFALRSSIASRKPPNLGRLSDRATTSKNRRSLEIDPNTPLRRVNSRSKARASIDNTFAASDIDNSNNMALDQKAHNLRVPRHCPHPLSKAVSPTSPLLQETHHETVFRRQPDRSPDERPAFSKSLPIGALRPHLNQPTPQASQGSSSGSTSFETPKPFVNAKPDPVAFRSTGLISKRHRNPDDMPPPPGGHGAMPDTPCKKAPLGFDVTDSPASINSVAKPRFGQPLFGTPAPQGAVRAHKDTDIGRSGLLNASQSDSQNRLNRSTSFISNDGSDSGKSPNGSHGQGESQSSADELPPTPTKQMFGGLPGVKTTIKKGSLRRNLFGRRTSIGPSTFLPPENNEPRSPDQNSSRRLFSQSISFPTATPVPQTPADTGFPDPSQLSISPNQHGFKTPSWRTGHRSGFPKAPETPSSALAPGHNFVQAGSTTTPSHHKGQHEVDPVLSARFKRVVWYGSGVFSEVYKVYQNQERPGATSYFSPLADRSRKTLSTTGPDAVFIVKRSKAQFGTLRGNNRKAREAAIMSALGQNDHVVRLFDSWEENFHLYLQTEFCEEGSLDAFLLKEGQKGRLDDFRIWKIMLEVAAGIKHIHDSGFLHLDIKPENIFIDFSGALKIGDFGLACEWPAPKSIEGEGDRRYMGPDLLLGHFDKPADIFAFGMMMYEIAGNCVPPDNGTNWQKLRSGDFSGLPSLTSGSTHSLNGVSSASFGREDTSNFDNPPWSPNTVYSSRPELSKLDTQFDGDVCMGSTESLTTPHASKQPQTSDSPATELAMPPSFVLNALDAGSLDFVVHWMMRPEPSERPTVYQVLHLAGCRWVRERRRAGATVWEGKWGPSDAVLMHCPQSVAVPSRASLSTGTQPDTSFESSQGTFFDDADAEMMDA